MGRKIKVSGKITGKAIVIKGYNTMGKKGSELGYIFRCIHTLLYSITMS